MSKDRYGSGSGTEVCYVVEARSSVGQPINIGSMVLDGEWRRCHFAHDERGIRVQSFGGADRHGFLDFFAANALAWSMLTNSIDYTRGDQGPWFRAIGVEARIVKVKYHYSYSAEEVGVGEPIGRAEERATIFTPREQPEAADAVDPVGAK